MAPRTRNIPLLGGTPGSVIGSSDVHVDSTSPGSTPAKNLSDADNGTDPSSYIYISSRRSESGRKGSLLSLSPDSRSYGGGGGRTARGIGTPSPSTGDSIATSGMRIENDTYVPDNPNGINNFRPEIIATIDFMPIWEPNPLSYRDGMLKNLSPVGELINFQYQTKQLRQETLQALIATVKSAAAATQDIANVQNDFKKELESVGNSLTLLNTVIQNVNLINDSLDIKEISNNNYVIRENDSNIPIPNLKQFALNNMQFNNTQYNNFSETKILLQLLFDFKNVLTNYSYNLLDLIDNDRAVDTSVTNIDKSYNISDGFSFSIKNFRSITNIDAIKNLNNLNRSLPADPRDVIKLLIYILSKEFLVSTGLGKTENQDLISKYRTQSTIGTSITIPQENIFNNIIGDIGDNIFQKPINQGTNSLINAFYIDPGLGNNNIVLPFENRYITSDESTLYIPGNSYFTDTIIDTNTARWNIKPYTDYVTAFSTTYNNAKTTIQRLLNLNSYNRFGLPQTTSNDQSSSTSINLLSPTMFFQKLIANFQNSFDRLTSIESTQLANNLAVQQEIEFQILEVKRLSGEIEPDLQALANLVSDYTLDSEQQGAIDGYISTIEAKKEEINNIINTITNLKNNINQIDISDDQALIMTIYKLADLDPTLEKYLYILCILAGAWNNSTAYKNDFFDQITSTQYKIFDDLMKEVDLSIILTNEEIQFYNRARINIPLNYRASGFSQAGLEVAIEFFINKIIYRYIDSHYLQRLEETINVRRTEQQDLINPVFSSISLLNFSNIIMDSVFGIGKNVKNTLFIQIVNTINSLYEGTKQSGQVVGLLEGGNTKFNGIDLSMQFMFLHKLFIKFAQRYSTFELAGIVIKQEELSTSDIASIADKVGVNLQYIKDMGANLRYHNNSDEQNTFDMAQFILANRTNAERKYIGIKIDINRQNELQNAFDLIKTGVPIAPGSIQDPVQNTIIYGDLYDIYEKINSEFNYIRNVLGILDVITKRLTDTSTTISTFFRQTTLANFLATSPINNINLIKYPSQLRLSNLIYQDLKERVIYTDSLITLPGGTQTNVKFEQNDLIISDAITPSEYNAMISMLSENNAAFDGFQTTPTTDNLAELIQRNNKIVTIGIPVGLSKQMADRVTLTEFNTQGASGKQSDVLAINLYPSDMRFGEIVLKPKTYYVDLSLFATKKDFFDLNASTGETFPNLLRRIYLSDLTNPMNMQKFNWWNLREDSRYGFLTFAQKESIVRTATQSYLLEKYINCLTGLKYTEDVFLSTNSERLLHPTMVNVVNRYLSRNSIGIPATYTTTEEILSNPTISEQTKDTYRLMTYGNAVFNRNEIIRRVNTPKLFDRVYHLPIYVGASEIDLVATSQTEAGRAALEKPSVQRYIVSVPFTEIKYLISNQPDDLVIKEVFFNTMTNNTGVGSLEWDPITDDSRDTSRIRIV
jgi:hypothetical protein